jgi:hypothetical protein
MLQLGGIGGWKVKTENEYYCSLKVWDCLTLYLRTWHLTLGMQ